MERGRERKRRKKPTHRDVGRVVSIAKSGGDAAFLDIVLLCSVHLSGLFITGGREKICYRKFWKLYYV